jgi:hypothetical protein
MSEEEQYPSNSNLSKLRASVPVSPAKPSQQSEDQRPKAEKAIEGEASVKRKTVGKRFAAIFTGVSLKDIVDDAIDQAIIPGIKGMLLNAGERALDRVFGNGTGGTSRIPNAAARTMVTNVAHVAYNKFSAPNGAQVRLDANRPPMVMSRRGQSVHDFEEIEFQTRKDASIVLNLMYDRLGEYGSVSVAEFYAWADVRGNFTDNNYGWRDLTGAGPTRARNGLYVLNLPAPVSLND